MSSTTPTISVGHAFCLRFTSCPAERIFTPESGAAQMPGWSVATGGFEASSPSSKWRPRTSSAPSVWK